MTYLFLFFSTFNKYSVKHNNAEHLASNHHQVGLGLPLMFGDTRDDISKALPSTVIALYIPLVALIQPPPPVAINVVTHWVLRLGRYLPLLCPTCPRAANGSTADTFQPLWHKLCSQLLGGALSIVLPYRTNAGTPGALSPNSRAGTLSIVLPYLAAKAHAGCRLVDTR